MKLEKMLYKNKISAETLFAQVLGPLGPTPARPFANKVSASKANDF